LSFAPLAQRNLFHTRDSGSRTEVLTRVIRVVKDVPTESVETKLLDRGVPYAAGEQMTTIRAGFSRLLLSSLSAVNIPL
jgi:hypothetical protein